MTTSSNSFEYIVGQIIRKRCVPVAGAGVSNASSHPDDKEIHRVSSMVKSLKTELIKKRYKRFDASRHGSVCDQGCVADLKHADCKVDETNLSGSVCFFCDVVRAAKDFRLGNLAELFLWEFGNVDEAYRSLVKLLKIRDYVDLSPTPAHIYIAKLALEGLLSEVITTNYDCNFEKAYDQVSGGRNSDVIASLDGYRRRGAAFGEVHRLKVFKVNGCAENLGDCNDSKTCESILLTERQLQKWRNRKWAADIFRDRLRSKSLFFVGFGSDEPQIHHTLQAVLDEYTDDVESGDSHVLNTPSAPIVAIFEPQPSFHQQQIVKTYALYHGYDPQQGDDLIVRNPKPGNTLSADDLWASIYERTLRFLITEAVNSSQLAENASFTAVVPFSSMILGQILTSLEKSKDEDVLHDTAAPAWIADLRSVFGVKVERGRYYGSLASCVSILNGGHLGQYHPVIENKALLSELMLLLFLLHDHLQGRIESDDGCGLVLYFSKSSENDQLDRILYLNADPSILAGYRNPRCPAGHNTLAIMLGNAGASIRPSLRRLTGIDEELMSISPRNIITLGWKHIFNEVPYGASMESIRETILDAIESPTNYYYEGQPSIKRRSYLKPMGG